MPPSRERASASRSSKIAEQLRTDPEFRAEWERTALARAVAIAIVRYRTQHDLSQRELADRLSMKQPQVARLELGEVNPSMDTLMRISARLGIEFTIDVRPAGTQARNVTKRSQETASSARFAPTRPRFSSPPDRKRLKRPRLRRGPLCPTIRDAACPLAH
jgi:transcriptional regulator with XRE-family HTH domain